ncbi:hypothetical protein VTI28DRAFT_411 [Corynascus sepedonium]
MGWAVYGDIYRRSLCVSGMLLNGLGYCLRSTELVCCMLLNGVAVAIPRCTSESCSMRDAPLRCTLRLIRNPPSVP